jgi:hypothetical protein
MAIHRAPFLSLPTSLGRGNPPYKRNDGIRWPCVKAEKEATGASSTCKGGPNTSAMGVPLRTDAASKAASHLSKDMGNDKEIVEKWIGQNPEKVKEAMEAGNRPKGYLTHIYSSRCNKTGGT